VTTLTCRVSLDASPTGGKFVWDVRVEVAVVCANAETPEKKENGEDL
jgi:hypothetical protein